MKYRKSMKMFVWVFILLFAAGMSSQTLAARVAGEEGVISSGGSVEIDRPVKAAKTRPKASGKTRPEVKKRSAQAAEDQKRTERPSKGEVSGERYVTIDFNDVDLNVFIKFISELTGKNFVVDKAVRGNVTIVSPTKISIKEAYRVFESVLEVHGFTTVPSGSIIKIVPAVAARSKDVATMLMGQAKGREDKIVTQIIPLRFADPDQIKRLFTPLVSKSSVIVSYTPTGMLIITDVFSNIKRLVKIIEVIDVEGIGEEISVIPLEHATAGDLAKSLTTLFQKRQRSAQKGATAEPGIKIVADDRTNSLIIMASEDTTQRIKELIALLDKEPSKGEGDIHVYYLQNADAEELAKVLTAIPTGDGKKEAKGKAPVISKDVKIVADKATNSLVITAKKDDFLVLEEVIGKLDIPRRMVYIEALIMEVNVNKDFSLGVEWRAGEQTGSHDDGAIGVFGGSGGGGADGAYSIFPGVDATGQVLAFPSAFSVGVLGAGIKIGDIFFPTLGAVFRAYQKDNDVHILSTPQIMTTDNEEAEITVGKNVPYITRQDTSSANVDYTSYEYKDVGVTLKITPQINQERFVRLNLFQEVTRLIEAEGLGEGRPTTFKRSTQTTVIIKDGNTVVIGGLIGDDTTNVDYEVPCLGGVPVIGKAFQSVSKANEKTNLFIFLTPHIIENPEEADEVYKVKKEQIDKVKEGVIKMYERKKDRASE